MSIPEIYITAARQVSVQQPLSEAWMEAPIAHTEPYNRSIEPDVKAFLSAGDARRMGKLLKRALATSLSAMKDSGVEHPDAIITGTGLGSVENTELFLTALVREGEQLLKPTQFMQSTHNTTSSLIGIHTHSHGYNITYSQKGISFESALYDAWLQFSLGRISTALVGSHDEVSPTYYQLLCKSGFLGQQSEICGEAAVSVMLADPSHSRDVRHLCRLAGVELLYRPDEETLKATLGRMLKDAGLKRSDISAVMLGTSGQTRNDEAYGQTVPMLCPEMPLLHYKHIFGESYSASGLGFYAAAQCLAAGKVPACLCVDKPLETAPSALLLLNIVENKHFTLTLLCGDSCR